MFPGQNRAKAKKHLHALTESEAARLLVVPRIHLDNLRREGYLEDRCADIGNVFNIALALASRLNVPHLVDVFNKGLALTVLCIRDERAPSDEEWPDFLAYYDAAERYIRKQNRINLLRAINYVDLLMARNGTYKIRDIKAGAANEDVQRILHKAA